MYEVAAILSTSFAGHPSVTQNPAFSSSVVLYDLTWFVFLYLQLIWKGILAHTAVSLCQNIGCL